MSDPKSVAIAINQQIVERLKTRDKLVVAIDGYAGSGKTTAANYLGEMNQDVLVVHLDDFIHHWLNRKKWMDERQDRSEVFEFNWYRYDELEKLIKQFKLKSKGLLHLKTYDFDKNDFTETKSFDLSKKVLVIDGIFLFHPKHEISRFWDLRVYLNIDFVSGDERRIAREKKKWGKQFLPDDHPDSYVSAFKEAYQRYIDTYDPKRLADVNFDL